MKVSFTKKKILISTVLLITIILLVFLGIFFLRKFFLNEELDLNDRHAGILSECTVSNEGSFVIYNCNAFLKGYEERENQECFYLQLINKNYRIQEEVFCYDIGEMQWDSKNMLSDKLIPVSLEIIYKISFLKEKSLEDVSLALLSDDETFDLTDQLSSKGYSLEPIELQGNIEKERLGYYLQTSSPDFLGKEINFLTFLSAKISKLEKDEEGYLLEGEIELNKKWIKISARTNEFLYYDFVNSTTSTVDLSKIDNNRVYGLSAFYFPSEIEIEGACDNLENLQSDYVIFCKNIKGKEISKLTISVEKYLSDFSWNEVNNVDKLIFFLITEYGEN